MGKLEYENWEQRWNQVFEKYDERDYLSFNSDERIWLNVRGLIDAINNGGIISYYYNHGANDLLDDTLVDLQKIDAIDVVNMLQKVNELFPNGNPSKNIDEQNEVIDSWEDGQYDDLLESLDERFYDGLEGALELKLDKVVKILLNENA